MCRKVHSCGGVGGWAGVNLKQPETSNTFVYADTYPGMTNKYAAQEVKSKYWLIVINANTPLCDPLSSSKMRLLRNLTRIGVTLRVGGIGWESLSQLMSIGRSPDITLHDMEVRWPSWRLSSKLNDEITGGPGRQSDIILSQEYHQCFPIISKKSTPTCFTILTTSSTSVCGKCQQHKHAQWCVPNKHHTSSMVVVRIDWQV